MVRFLEKLEGVRFIELGANNGKTLDPLWPLVRKHHWSGVFVEPQEKPFRKLKKKYRHVPGIAFEKAVILDYDGEATFYNYPGYDVVSSAKVSNWKLEKAIAEGKVKAMTLPCMTISTLIAKHHMEDAQVLQMDIEGSEYDVLKTLEIRPKIIRYEEKHLGEDKEPCRQMLRDWGYSLELESTEDVTAWIQ